MLNRLHRYIHRDGGFKVSIVNATRVGQDLFKRLQPQPIALQLITQAAAGALLLSTSLKDEGTILLRVDGDGPLGFLTAEANTRGTVRGMAGNLDTDFEVDPQKGLFQQALGAGRLTVKRCVKPSDKVFSSVVDLSAGEMAHNLANYLLQSEQIPSALQLGALLDPHTGIRGAGGIFIQALPNSDANLLFILEERLKELPALGSIFSDENGHREIISYLFDDIPVKQLKVTETVYRCNCSFERIVRGISALPHQELEEMQRENRVFEIRCSFCNKAYQLGTAELNQIIELKVQDATNRAATGHSAGKA